MKKEETKRRITTNKVRGCREERDYDRKKLKTRTRQEDTLSTKEWPLVVCLCIAALNESKEGSRGLKGKHNKTQRFCRQKERQKERKQK